MTSHTPHLLLVDDDTEFAGLVSRYLRRHQYDVTTTDNGRDGLGRALNGRYDLVLVDVMLPGVPGFELLRYLRRRSTVPIIMVTARAGRLDLVRGLRSGADDYLVKPFDPEELLARIEAVLRRANQRLPEPLDVIQAGGLTLDIGTRVVAHADFSIELTSIEADILEFLMRAIGRAVSREEMTALLHQRQTTPSERSIDVHISHLRRKLGEFAAEGLIQTVRSVGYIFTGVTA